MSGWFTINAAIGMFSSQIIKPQRLPTYINTGDEKVKLYVSLTTALPYNHYLQSPGASSDIRHDVQSRFDWKIRFRI